jgi:hypothetical protein
MVICLDSAHRFAGLNGLMIEDDTVVGEAELGTARHNEGGLG